MTTSNDTSNDTSNEYNYIIGNITITEKNNVYTINGTIYQIPATTATATATATVAAGNNESDV